MSTTDNERVIVDAAERIEQLIKQSDAHHQANINLIREAMHNAVNGAHVTTTQQPYVCEYCSSAFSSPSAQLACEIECQRKDER